MNASAEKILEDALRLPEPDRAELVASLMDSLESRVDEDTAAAWDAEIGKRVAELDSRTVEPVPWAEARGQIRGRTNGPPGP